MAHCARPAVRGARGRRSQTPETYPKRPEHHPKGSDTIYILHISEDAPVCMLDGVVELSRSAPGLQMGQSQGQSAAAGQRPHADVPALDDGALPTY